MLERIGNVGVVLAEVARAPYDYAKRRAAHAIIAASEAAYNAAVERAEPALRPSLLALAEPVAEAA